MNDALESSGISELLKVLRLQNALHILREFIVKLGDVRGELVMDHWSVDGFFDGVMEDQCADNGLKLNGFTVTGGFPHFGKC